MKFWIGKINLWGQKPEECLPLGKGEQILTGKQERIFWRIKMFYTTRLAWLNG